MQQTNQEIIDTIIAVVILLIIISIIILLLTVYYSNSKKRLLKEKELLKASHEQTILQLKMEIQEETLTNISREIHDNITQVLSFVKLNLAMMGNIDKDEIKLKIDENRDLVAQVINDLRNLSKSMSFEHIANIGLVKTIDIEIDRINSSGLLHALLLIDGNSYSLGEQRELVLFRIFQEALNNTLKHAKAKQLKITLQYSKQIFNLIVEDDGHGFSPAEIGVNRGSGLKNIQNRAALIGAVATIDSLPGKGCCIKVILNPLEQHIYADGNYPNSTG